MLHAAAAARKSLNYSTSFWLIFGSHYYIVYTHESLYISDKLEMSLKYIEIIRVFYLLQHNA